MARRGGAVHVATITRSYRGRLYHTHLLRRTYREAGQVRHQTLGNLSHLPASVLELVRRALRGETLVPAHEAFQTERNLPHGHVAAVVGTVRQLGLDRLIAARASRESNLVVAMIAARILNPGSKLATARGWERGEETSTLGQVLGVGGASEDELYAAMDWLLPRQGRIEAALAKRHLAEGGLVLYDVTSTYFEGHCCPLAQLGHSRDGRRDRLQIVFGLMTDREGCPVAVQVFEGNTADPTTLPQQVIKLRRRFGLQRMVVVGDRGMLTAARIREDLRPHELDWITALRAPAIRQLVEAGSLQLSLFDQRDLAEITDPAYPDERLIVCRNPLLAAERARKREELLAATERELAAIAAATRRSRQPLRGRDRIGLRVGKVLGRFKVGKHFHIAIEQTSLRYERGATAIAQEAALDGIYVLRTSVPAEALGTEATVRAYKSLSATERAFRSLKLVELNVRPIHHHLADRVRAHVLLCMLAYYVEWHLRQRLAPLLFDDEEPQAGEALRRSVVAPAQRSPRAQRKAQLRRTEDGLPIQSFPDLLKSLATLCRNRVRLAAAPTITFEHDTLPTPLQQRAFQLLGFSPTM